MLIVLLVAAGVFVWMRRAPAPRARVASPDSAPAPLAGPVAELVAHGRAIMLATRESLPANVGNRLRCVSCHLDEGRRAQGTWIGAYARYPQYMPRSATVATIEDRVNGCLRRSMNGRALAADAPAMRAMVAYLWSLSRGVPVDAPRAPRPDRFAGLRPDTAAGRALFAAKCARCHGPDGQGSAAAPPVWGPQSFNIGAGMARYRTAAAFILANMPFDQPGTLTPREALDVAGFVTARPRPDFPGKARDWPRGGAPSDAPYRTAASSTAAAPAAARH